MCIRDRLRTSRIRHRSRARSHGLTLDPLLQLLNQILKEGHDNVNIFTQYKHNIVLNRIA